VENLGRYINRKLFVSDVNKWCSGDEITEGYKGLDV
jgi:hypothetical protein